MCKDNFAYKIILAHEKKKDKIHNIPKFDAIIN